MISITLLISLYFFYFLLDITITWEDNSSHDDNRLIVTSH